jgi:hypothetical protein
LPHDHTSSNEEQALLWRARERIPEIYREHQSIEAVAQSLELTEEGLYQFAADFVMFQGKQTGRISRKAAIYGIKRLRHLICLSTVTLGIGSPTSRQRFK